MEESTQRGFRASPTYLLAMLCVATTINWADRQVVPILFPAIRAELGLSDTQLGIIGGLAFSVVYALASFVFGRAADYGRRTRIIAFGLALWSVATAAGGLAVGFFTLFAARFFIGVGEASLYPCALSLIAQSYPQARRGLALGILGTAAALGGGLGVGLGGQMSEWIGWRNVFFLYGGAGLLLIPLLLSIPEAKRAHADGAREPMAPALRELAGDPRLVTVWMSGAAMIAAAMAFATWLPSYFVREHGLDVTRVGWIFGLSVFLGGSLGSLLGGHFADFGRRRRVGGDLDVSSSAACIALPLVALAIAPVPATLQMLCVVLAPIGIYAFFPPLQTTLVELVPPERHGIAYAMHILCLSGIGAALGPFVVGAVSDATESLLAGLAVIPVFLLLAIVLSVKAGREIRTRRASTLTTV
jgi:predicted MFS family arabinose efflux permease